MLLIGLAMAAAWPAVQDGMIEEAPLPPAEITVGFPELKGDFDGDGAEDVARARAGDAGVQIVMQLSSTEEPFIEALGAPTLHGVNWRVIGPEAFSTLCNDPIECPVSGIAANRTPRDSILVIIEENDRFILRWDGNALETFFI